ncbi:phosphoenolpyruvate carboxykinase (ATP), partial [candidate division WOR-3 bacterium]|nr:phosphoenolpyruvate carboxykinase (ATP) [candidate division WOR-3 bacterium]
SGGPYSIGKRIDLSYSRAMVTAALNGELDDIDFYKESYFNLMIPKSCPGVPDELLNPIYTWDNKDEYDRLAKELANKFNDNIKKFKGIEEDVLKSGPSLF